MASCLVAKFPAVRNEVLKSYNVFRRRKWNNASLDMIQVDIGGEPIKFSIGKIAKITDGCCVAKLGETSVMATAVCDPRKSSASSFVPLTVDFRQKAAAAGRIPMTRKRREFGETDKEILTSRVIDRSIRPLFPKGFSLETQISCNLLALDCINDPDILSINAASAALSLSDIPWNGPVGAVRVGLINDKIIINPTRQDLAKSSLNLIITATQENNVVMLEGSANHVLIKQFMEAIKAGVSEAQLIIKGILNLQQQFGKCKRPVGKPSLASSDMIESATLLCEAKFSDIFRDFTLDKMRRGMAVDAVIQETLEKLKESYTDCDSSILYQAINSVYKNTFRNLVLETGIRCDGRTMTDLRPISCEVDTFKPLHGSALFERGQTQVLCSVTLDSEEAALRNDPVYEIPGDEDKNFFLHYEFPPYATNEIGRVGKFGRREIGHGALAEKSLKPVIPVGFPFTIRLTSEVLASNGSSSMATVCGGSLALMDAGVPISVPVAGVAIGLITAYNTEDNTSIEKYAILADILGLEDYLGDMDFKVSGSEEGITAVQLDVKIPGLPLNIIDESLSLAADSWSKILNIMNQAISKPREEKKKSWPVIETLEVPLHKLGQFIGSGGMNLKKIHSRTGVQLTHKEEGLFTVFAPNSQAMQEAKEIVDKLLLDKMVPEFEYGAIYSAKIVEVKDSGVMVTLHPNMKPTFIKNSMLDHKKIKHSSALGLEVDQEILVKYFGRDPVDGKMRLSRSALKTPLALKIS